MKANGRRAWRKYAKREQRRAVGQDFYWTHDARGNVATHGRRHLKQFGPRPPAREFAPRSLVGMTQGARKRAWVAGRLHRFLFPHGVNTDALEMESAYSWSEIRATRAFLGQRLRPCPGKHGCRNCTRTCGACEDQCPDDTRCPRCGSVMTTEGPFCDGSGVLPAGAGR